MRAAPNTESKRPLVAMGDRYMDAFMKLPPSIQRKAYTMFSRFVNAPTSAGRNYEKIRDGASDFYYSARIDDNYRAIIAHPKEGNVYLFMWADSHEEAYRWARTHVCSVNARTNCIQVYETMDTSMQLPVKAGIDTAKQPEPEKKIVVAAESTPVPPLPKAEPLFRNFSDEDLLSISVPEDRLEPVRQVKSREELDFLREKLPPDAYESLVWLADGEDIVTVREAYASVETVDANDIESVLKTERSRRSFRVIESDADMQAIMDASLEKWRVFLHPIQKRLVEKKALTPTLVRGAAGTGKTVVAMHRAVELVRRGDIPNGKKLLFTTFTRNLAVDIETSLRTLCTPDEMRKIEVVNIDAWVAGFLRKNRVNIRIVYPSSDEYEKRWDAALTMVDPAEKLPVSFYDEEWRRVVLPQEIRSEDEYLKASRKGRGVSISRKQRKAIWPVFEAMRNELSQAKAMTIEDACFMALRMQEAKAGLNNYAAVIVDETQDMGTESLKLLACLARNSTDEEPRIFLVGDGQQRIYARTASLSACGINVRGRRSERLKLTYRTTEEIRKVANRVLFGESFDDMDEGNESLKGNVSFRHGQNPVLHVAGSLQEEVDWVAGHIKELLDSSEFKPQDICVVSRTNKDIRMYAESLANKGIKGVQISRNLADDSGISGIRLATMHRVKGLEYKAVFIVGADEGRMPLVAGDTDDVKEKKTHELTERSLFYVAASRARDALFISSSGKPGQFLNQVLSDQ